MIVGFGVDIVSSERVQRIASKYGSRFLNRVFTPEEIQYCTSRAHGHIHLAGRFAAKEAVLKALGTGWRFGIAWNDIEVLNNVLGRPELRLSGRAREISNRIRARQFFVSISHDGAYAVAAVVMEG